MLRPSVILLGLMVSPASADEELTVVSWGGAYEAAQHKAVFGPYSVRTGKALRILEYGDLQGFSEGRAISESWDVVDLQEDQAITACAEGLLNKLDPADIFGTAELDQILSDFVPGSIGDCHVTQNLYAAVIAFNDSSFPGEKPGQVEDFFDLEKFPGKRALPRNPDAILEWALLAVGVPASQIYDLLSTDRGLRLALRKLETIRSEIIWWDELEASLKLLQDGTASMSAGYNGRFFSAALIGAPVTILWDGRILGYEVWAIPASTKQLEAAKHFIAFATSPEQLANLAEEIPYGPARESALARVGRNTYTGIPMAAHLPNAPHHKGRVLVRDSIWYAKTSELRRRRFDDWLAGSLD